VESIREGTTPISRHAAMQKRRKEIKKKEQQPH